MHLLMSKLLAGKVLQEEVFEVLMTKASSTQFTKPILSMALWITPLSLTRETNDHEYKAVDVCIQILMTCSLAVSMAVVLLTQQ